MIYQHGRKALLVAVVLVGFLHQVYAAERKRNEPTLQSLSGKRIEVAPNSVSGIDREQAAQAYRHFLELQSADPGLRVEAMRRLADLNVETTEESQIASQAEGTLVSGLNESIALYEKLLAAYPDYSHADIVLYQLSRAYESAGQPAKALNALDKLVKQFPGSRWYGESQFRRGEILFSSKRYSEASDAYAAVVKLAAATSFHDQALYKQGWSLFKQGKVDDSAVSFMAELDRLLLSQHRLRDDSSLSRAEHEMKDDILHVLAVMATDENGADSITVMLAAHGDTPYAYQLYTGLGDFYMEKERYQDAAQAFSTYARLNPDALQAPALLLRAIDAYQKGGFTSKVLDAKQAFVEGYAFDKSFWSGRKPSEAPEVAAQLQQNLLELAQYYHAQSGKTKKETDYSAATRWYRTLLESFPDDVQAPEHRFLLAELLFDSGRYAEAVREYLHTAYDYPVHARSAVAGYAALVAYKKQELKLSGDDIDKWHHEFIDSEIRFATTYPDDIQSVPVLTKAAEDLFALNEFDRTVAVAQQLLSYQPAIDSKQRRTAATLLAHSLFDLGRYQEAEVAYIQVRQLLASNDADMPAINERIAASIYRQAEAKQKDGDSLAAVDDYLRVAVLAPASKISANAEFDAATILINLDQWPRAVAVLEQFRREHPGHELEAEAGKKLAVGYQQIGKNMDAAAEYERIASRGAEAVEVRRVALLQAADIYLQAAGKGDQAAGAHATSVYTGYVTHYPRPFSDSIEARQHLAELAVMNKDAENQARWLRELVKADRQAGAERTDRSRYLAAHASLELLQPVVDKFSAIRLTAPLSKSLKLKRAAMEAALTAYGQALDYQMADVTTEATYGMAEMYRQMGADLMASERPKQLDADALEQYEVLLEEQAFPFEEKAIALHESNLHHASAGIYDGWIQKSYAALVKLVPARYSRAELSGEYVNALQ